MSGISILFLSYNRQDLAKETLTRNLKNIGLKDDQWELLICDQGTQDEEYLAWLQNQGPSYLRLNKYNEGIARALNQLILRTQFPHSFFMPNDIPLPDNWGAEILCAASDIPNSGIVGFEGQGITLPEIELAGKSSKKYLVGCNLDPHALDAPNNCQVFGPILVTQQAMITIGAFCEDYHPFGFEDSDICFRAQRAGLKNYYLKGFKYEHLGEGRENNPPAYKAIKDYCLASNVGHHRWRMANYERIGTYIPFPILKRPTL